MPVSINIIKLTGRKVIDSMEAIDDILLHNHVVKVPSKHFCLSIDYIYAIYFTCYKYITNNIYP